MRKAVLSFLFIVSASLTFISASTAFAEISEYWQAGGKRVSGGSYGFAHEGGSGSVLVYGKSSYGILTIQKADKAGSLLWGSEGSIVDSEVWQGMGEMVSDGNGGAIATLRTASGLYAKHFDSSGVEDLSWGINGVFITSGYGREIQAASDMAGGAIVVWQENSDLYAQRISNTGQLLWNSGSPVIVCAGYASLHHMLNQANNIVSDGNGGVFIAWMDGRDGTTTTTYAQHLNSQGVPQWQVNGVLAHTSAPYGDLIRDLAADGSGGAILTIVASNKTLVAQRVDSTGGLPWGAAGVTIATNLYGSQGFSFIEPVGNGEFIVTWDGNGATTSQYDVYAQKIDLNGAIKWSQNIAVSAADSYDYFPQISGDGSSGAWISFLTYDSSWNFVWSVQHVDGSGVVCAPPLTIAPAASKEWEHSSVPDGEGGVYLVWPSWSGMYAQRVVGRADCGGITVQIDIKPGSYPNSIKLQEQGSIPVAIFGTQDFYVADVDVESLRLEGAMVRILNGKKILYSYEDINSDGLNDLVVQFDRGEFNPTAGDSEATVTGSTYSGSEFTGTDSVRVIE